jgi:hypothetical protein
MTNRRWINHLMSTTLSWTPFDRLVVCFRSRQTLSIHVDNLEHTKVLSVVFSRISRYPVSFCMAFHYHDSFVFCLLLIDPEIRSLEKEVRGMVKVCQCFMDDLAQIQ